MLLTVVIANPSTLLYIHHLYDLDLLISTSSVADEYCYCIVLLLYTDFDLMETRTTELQLTE